MKLEEMCCMLLHRLKRKYEGKKQSKIAEVTNINKIAKKMQNQENHKAAGQQMKTWYRKKLK